MDKKRFRYADSKQLMYASYDRLVALWQVESDASRLDTSYGSTHVITAGDRDNPPLLLHGTGDHSAMTWIATPMRSPVHSAVDIPGGAGKTEPNDRFYRQFAGHTLNNDYAQLINRKLVEFLLG